MKINKQEYSLHEEGEKYAAWVKRIEDAGEGTYGPQLKWVFEIEGEEEREQFAWSGTAMTPRSKLTKWVKNLHDGVIPETVDTEELHGVPCSLLFEHSDNPDGTVSERVVNVLPRKGAKVKDFSDEAPF